MTRTPSPPSVPRGVRPPSPPSAASRVHPPSPAPSRLHTVEAMRWWDIEQVTELEQVLFAEDSPWTAAMFWAELAAGHHYVVCRDCEGRVIGYAGLAIGGDAADVQTIGVAPAKHGRGIGRALLRDLLRAAHGRSVFLEVRCDNAPAIALYESEGFARTGIRRRYYQPSGADAYTMLRPPEDPRLQSTNTANRREPSTNGDHS